jgi:hypothetical protein
MRFVATKTADQLDLQALHRVRERLVGLRTGIINQIRAFLLERAFCTAARTREVGTAVCLVAVVFGAGLRGSARSARFAFMVRIHAAQESWTICGPASSNNGPLVDTQGDNRRFAGEVFGRFGEELRRRTAVVLETDHSVARAAESIEVWAEIFTPDESRSRVGSPFMAEIVARDRARAAVYHATSAARDSTEIFPPAADHLTAAAAGNVADPRAHAPRLATILLPDVVSYSAALPVVPGGNEDCLGRKTEVWFWGIAPQKSLRGLR